MTTRARAHNSRLAARRAGDGAQAGGRTILEYRKPASDLAEFNASIVGLIVVIAEYHRDAAAGGTGG